MITRTTGSSSGRYVRDDGTLVDFVRIVRVDWQAICCGLAVSGSYWFWAHGIQDVLVRFVRKQMCAE